MWLKSLHVENFRGFEQLDVTFDEHMTLLLGGNGAGKTGVLEAIKVALGSYFAGIDQSPDQAIDIAHARRVVGEINGVPDLQEQWPVRVAVNVDIEAHRGPPGVTAPTPPQSLAWERTRASRDGRTNWGSDTIARDWGVAVQSLVQRGLEVHLPVVASYGTGRL